jgi:hypothetical protein
MGVIIGMGSNAPPLRLRRRREPARAPCQRCCLARLSATYLELHQTLRVRAVWGGHGLLGIMIIRSSLRLGLLQEVLQCTAITHARTP